MKEGQWVGRRWAELDGAPGLAEGPAPRGGPGAQPDPGGCDVRAWGPQSDLEPKVNAQSFKCCCLTHMPSRAATLGAGVGLPEMSWGRGRRVTAALGLCRGALRAAEGGARHPKTPPLTPGSQTVPTASFLVLGILCRLHLKIPLRPLILQGLRGESQGSRVCGLVTTPAGKRSRPAVLGVLTSQTGRTAAPHSRVRDHTWGVRGD